MAGSAADVALLSFPSPALLRGVAVLPRRRGHESRERAYDPSVRDYADTSYENRGGHRPDFLSIVVRAGVLGVSPAELGRNKRESGALPAHDLVLYPRITTGSDRMPRMKLE